jgi:hypothetical protein
MAQQPASTLGFIREGLVDEKGQPKRGFLKYLQQVTTAVSYLTPLGIKPTAPIVGASKTIGGATANLSASGTLPSASLTGAITGPQVGFTLDEVPDGTKRFAVINATSLNGVALVDSANLAIINLADTAHQNKILDNVSDGVTYQRFSRIASGVTTLATTSIGSGSSNLNTGSAPGTLATDTILWSLGGAPGSGYSASAAGSLYILAYATAGNVNFYVGNSTAAPIIPGAQTVNWQVIR